MSQSTLTTAVDWSTPAAAPMSRRVLLAAGAGLAGAAAAASSTTPAHAQTRLGSGARGGAPQMPAVQAPVRPDWLAKRTEEILEPGLPIIDPHHHLWDAPRYRYMFPELLADLASGHNIVATMYEQAREMYRADGPEELKSLGETEFITGVAAMSASGKYGPTKCMAGITGYVDLRLGSRAKGVIERHLAVSDGRLKAIRNGSTWSDDPVLKPMSSGMPPGLLLDKTFREGVATLAGFNLAFDAWMFQTQLGDLVDLARAMPQTTMVLNHIGGPVAIGPYAGKRDEAFKEWRGLIQQIGALPEHLCQARRARHENDRLRLLQQSGAALLGRAGQGMETVYRDLHHGVRSAALDVREQLPGRQGYLQLPGIVERVQAAGRRLLARRKNRPVQRRCQEGLSPGSLARRAPLILPSIGPVIDRGMVVGNSS